MINLASLIACNVRQFPNTIPEVLQILVVMPLTSCEAERLFSRLRQLKSYSKSTMKERRLNSLALMLRH